MGKGEQEIVSSKSNYRPCENWPNTLDCGKRPRAHNKLRNIYLRKTTEPQVRTVRFQCVLVWGCFCLLYICWCSSSARVGQAVKTNNFVARGGWIDLEYSWENTMLLGTVGNKGGLITNEWGKISHHNLPYVILVGRQWTDRLALTITGKSKNETAMVSLDKAPTFLAV